uniref:Uncharacterized protein n=1 Tax=Salmonella sp. TaxID=599 RepID=A0A482ETC2_SALSP|nr:hypothetical protein NNIBIDOC_00129 [Salmonella sp.]
MQSLNALRIASPFVRKSANTHRRNNRNYVIQSVRDTFSFARNKRRIALGEITWYYGHGRRATL